MSGFEPSNRADATARRAASLAMHIYNLLSHLSMLTYLPKPTWSLMSMNLVSQLRSTWSHMSMNLYLATPNSKTYLQKSPVSLILLNHHLSKPNLPTTVYLYSTNLTTTVKSGNFVTFLAQNIFFTKLCEGTPYFFF